MMRTRPGAGQLREQRGNSAHRTSSCRRGKRRTKGQLPGTLPGCGEREIKGKQKCWRSLEVRRERTQGKMRHESTGRFEIKINSGQRIEPQRPEGEVFGRKMLARL